MSGIDRLLAIMTRLRDPQAGCPWDLQQDFRSIAPHTLEEAYEVIDAIEREDHAHLANELGDLLFQVVFLAQLGQEQDLFGFDDVVDEIVAKLLHRHPHIFPEGTLESAGERDNVTPTQVADVWERLKAEERAARQEGAVSLLDDVALALPALLRAAKLQKRAARAGFDWPDARGVLRKLHEEIAELEQALDTEDRDAIGEELGDVLFTVVNLARHLDRNPESSLREASRKFETRFRAMEARVRESGRSIDELDSDALEGHWQAVKDTERGRKLKP